MSNNDKETEDKPQDQEQSNSQITTNDFINNKEVKSSEQTDINSNNDNKNTLQTSNKPTNDENNTKTNHQTTDNPPQTHDHHHNHHRRTRSSSNHRSRRKKHRSRRKYNSRSPSRSYSRSRSHSPSHSRSRSRGSTSPKSRSRSRSASYSPRPHSNTDRTRSRDQLSLHNPSVHQTPRNTTRPRRSRTNRRQQHSDSPQESTYANALKGSTGRTYNIFVKNLPRTCLKQDLRGLFSRFGEIYSCAVIKRKKNPTTKCFGFVNFATEQAQNKAVRASGKIHMNDSMIECEVSSNVTVVYMGNLPLDATKSDIRYHVRTYGGSYKSIHIRHGHCFIVYDSYYAAEKAIQQLQNTSINGSAVWVAIASETKAKMLSSCPELPGQRSLFIGNLATSVKEDELRDIFIKYGRMTSVRIPRLHGNNKARGFAFVEYENSGDAELALRGESGKAVHGQKLDIDWCRENGKGHDGHSDFGHNRGGFHNMATVQVMPHLDTKTLDTLPVMEVEPGKFVKVIPASFMQSTQFQPRRTSLRRSMNNYASPQGKFHGNMRFSGYNQNRMSHPFEGNNRGRGRRDRRAPPRRDQGSISRSRTRSRSRSNSHKRQRHRRHRSRHKSKHSDHHKTRHRSSRSKKKDGEKKGRESRRKHRHSKSEEKGERRLSSHSRSRSGSFRDKSESRGSGRSRSRSRSMSSDRSRRSRSGSYNEKVAKHRSNSCDDVHISKQIKSAAGNVESKDGKESKDTVNDIAMKEDKDNEDKITTTTILNDASDDVDNKKDTTDNDN